MDATREPDDTMPMGRTVVRKKSQLLGRSWRLSRYVVVWARIWVTTVAKMRCHVTSRIAVK